MIVNAKYQQWEDYLGSIPKIFDHEGRTIYTGRNLIKVLSLPDGTAINVTMRREESMHSFTHPACVNRKDCGPFSIHRNCFPYPSTPQKP